MEPDDSRLQGSNNDDFANELGSNELGNDLNNELLQANNNMLNTTNQEKSLVSIKPPSPIKHKKKRHRRYISIAKGMEMEMEENVGSQILVRANMVNYHGVTKQFDRRPSYEILSVLG